MSDDDKTHLSGQVEVPSKPAPPLQIVPGVVLKGTYRIDAELGSGGMGTVYRATHIGLEKVMAVKVLSHRAISTPESLARFEREAKVAGKVSHPAMTDVIDFGVEQGTPYIVMEYVSGVELADLIERQGPMPPRRAVAVMRQIVSLLRTAHGLGIVHRDLKPSNIKIIQESSEDTQIFVKVLDFGIAKVVGDVSGQLTSEGMLVGTPAYMAPEQINGQPIDGRTDLYAAGLIFHEMLSGKRAYKGETIARILHAQMNEPPPPLTLPLPDVVRQTLQKFYEKRPEDRFQDAAEADQALMLCEDALRPPSVNLAAASVLPAAGNAASELERSSSVRTQAFRPRPVEPAPVSSGEPTPGTSERKPPSSVAVAPSLVRERPSTQEEPAIVPAMASRAGSSPVTASKVPPPPVAAHRSSGSGKVLAVLGVAFVLLVAGLAGVVWAWQSGRLAGLVPFAPSRGGEGRTETGRVGSNTGTASASKPKEPVKNEPAPTEPQPTGDTGEAPTEPVATAETDETEEQGQGGDDAQAPPDAQGTPREEPPPPEERLSPGCYVAVVSFESTREPGGSYGPWMPKGVNSRKSIKCSAVPRQDNIRHSQGLFEHWPESPSEKPLYYNPQVFEPQKKGEPNTRRMVVKAYTRVSGNTP